MRIHHLIIILLFYFNKALNAQGYSLPEYRTSPNGSYIISQKSSQDDSVWFEQITLEEDGYEGSTKLWSFTTSQKYCVNKPVVSNDGFVALHYPHSYEFYNIEGSKLGEYIIPANQIELSDDEFESNKSMSFSTDSKYFYTYAPISSGKGYESKTNLFCLLLNGKLLWEYDLGVYNVVSLEYSCDKLFVFNEKEIKVFSKLGKFLQIIYYDFKVLPYLDNKRNLLYVFRDNKVFRYNLMNVDDSSTIPIESIFDLLATFNPTALNFILSSLEYIENYDLKITTEWLNKLKQIIIVHPNYTRDVTNGKMFSLSEKAFFVYEKYR
jgi:hypothetical protein